LFLNNVVVASKKKERVVVTFNDYISYMCFLNLLN